MGEYACAKLALNARSARLPGLSMMRPGITRRALLQSTALPASLLAQGMATRNIQPQQRAKRSGMPFDAKFADIARRYNVPMNPDILRIFRATFLYDTAIFRLWNQLDMAVEYRRYRREAGRRARKRVRRALRKRLEKGLTTGDYARIEDLGRMGRQLLARIQHYLDAPQPDFALIASKASFVMSLVLRLATWSLAAYVAAVGAVAAYGAFTARAVNLLDVLKDTSGNKWFRLVLAAGALMLIRKTSMKFDEVDTR